MPETLTVVPWSDPLLDSLGHDPRSRYVETFWLPTLGPTAVLLMRHLADRFDHDPKGVQLQVADTSQALGVGQRDGNSSPIVRTLTRLAQFELACEDGRGTVAVRRNLPPINPRHLRRLPSALQHAHGAWVEARQDESPMAEARRRSRRVAYTLLEQGDEPDRVERVLHSMGFHPSLCHESARWAYDRQRESLDHLDLAAS
jgi:hypothetical protein